MNRFLSNKALWRELRHRVATARRVEAAVAYFGSGGAKTIPLKAGDTLVVDMCIASVRKGNTDPREIRKLINKGVHVFSRASLHAKLFLVDGTVIASSANVSQRSETLLDEAGIITTDAAVVRRARDFIRATCTEPVRSGYLKKCLEAYRPPDFGAASNGIGARRGTKSVEAKLWFVGGLIPVEPPRTARSLLERIERVATKKLRHPDLSEVTWIHYRRKPKYLREIGTGDWVIQCTRYGRSYSISPPAQVIGQDTCEPPSGRKLYLLLLEYPTAGEPMHLSQFRRRISSAFAKLNRARPRTCAVPDGEAADAILRLWTPGGRISKRGRRA